MEIYRLHYPENVTPHNGKSYSLAVGFFDGLHKGHQAVINKAIEKANSLNIESAVMTFDPHPSHVLGNRESKVQYITTFEEKCSVLREMGVDTVFVVTFNKSLASLSPAEFITTFIKNLGVKHVTAGFDFTFGSKGAGTMQQMEQYANGEYGTTIIGKVTDSEEEISSTRVRNLVANGKVNDASKLLGRPYKVTGTVVDGDKRGRLIGFPTANVLPDELVIFPGKGVYAVRFIVAGKIYNGVCNVGVKPTFTHPDLHRVSIEVHILDFDADIYGQTVEVDWVEKIRDEKKFESIDDLVKQIGADKETAAQLLSAYD